MTAPSSASATAPDGSSRRGGGSAPPPAATAILVEIVGATNLTPHPSLSQGSSASSPSPPSPNRVVTGLPNAASALTSSILHNTILTNAAASPYVKVLWGEEKVHKTDVVPDTNGPIWTVENGSLFVLEPSSSQSSGDDNDNGDKNKGSSASGDGNKDKDTAEHPPQSSNDKKKGRRNEKVLTFEVRDRDALVPGRTALIGTVRLDEQTIREICCCTRQQSRRLEFPVVEDAYSAARDGILRWRDGESEEEEEDSGDASDAASESPSSLGTPSKKRSQGSSEGETATWGDDAAMLALRFRSATPDDLRFMTLLKGGKLDEIASLGDDTAATDTDNHNNNRGAGTARNASSSTRRSSSALITEEDANLVSTSMNVMDSVKFTLNASTGRGHKRKVRVKPGPDPARPPDETRFLSEEELVAACYSESKDWIEAGSSSGNSSGHHGRVLVEVLHCDGLPNYDAGGGVVSGSKGGTQAFVCIVCEDAVVQTNRIENCLSPVWLPWTQRAFAVNRTHPLSAMYVGVFHYNNVNPLRHDGIGRAVVNLQQFRPGHVYTLGYNLYPSSVYSHRTPTGTITLRLRVCPPAGGGGANERSVLLGCIKPAPSVSINVKKRKSLSVVRYTCFGSHDEDRFDINLLKSQANEMQDYVQAVTYSVGDAVRSLLFWRGQVRVGKVNLPLYSLVAFVCGAYVVERPHLAPSLFFWCITFFMLASYGHRCHHPSPWHRCRPVADFISIMLRGKSSPLATRIRANEGAKEAAGLEQGWKGRLELDTVAAAKALELRQSVSEIEDVAAEAKGNTSKLQIDPMAMLLPVQKKLEELCYFPRMVKSVVTWESSAVSFLITMSSFVAAVTLCVLPSAWLIQWICRVAVWALLGPHMKLVDTIFNSQVDYEDEGDRLKHQNNVRYNMMKKFKEKGKVARIKGEDTLKLNAMRKIRLGSFVAQVPSQNVTRYFDYPLADSMAVPVTSSQESIKGWEDRKIVPGQHLYGTMIPTPSQAEVQAKSKSTPVTKDQPKGKTLDATDENAADDGKREETTNTDVLLVQFSCRLAQAQADLDVSQSQGRKLTGERNDALAEIERLQTLVEDLRSPSRHRYGGDNSRNGERLTPGEQDASQDNAVKIPEAGDADGGAGPNLAEALDPVVMGNGDAEIPASITSEEEGQIGIDEANANGASSATALLPSTASRGENDAGGETKVAANAPSSFRRLFQRDL